MDASIAPFNSDLIAFCQDLHDFDKIIGESGDVPEISLTHRFPEFVGNQLLEYGFIAAIELFNIAPDYGFIIFC
jgi:hypothetical protein